MMKSDFRYITTMLALLVFMPSLLISCTTDTPGFNTSTNEISKAASDIASTEIDASSMTDSLSEFASIQSEISSSNNSTDIISSRNQSSNSQASYNLTSSAASSGSAVLDIPVLNDGVDDIGFGFYGVGEKVNPDVYNMVLESDYINIMFAGGGGASVASIVEQVRAIKEHGKTCWVQVYDSTFVRSGDKTVLRDNFKTNLIEITKALTDADVYDCVRGIYLDEPFLQGISKEELYEMTRFYRLLNDKKGVFICFSVTAICPDIWKPDYPVDQLDEKTSEYITDIAFDMYWDYSEYEYLYKKITNRMYEITRNHDTKYWFVPMTMSGAGKSTENTSIEHTNGLYELLKESPNPGGLVCYSYWTIPPEYEALGNINLDILLDKNNPDRWALLEQRLLVIGEQIVSGKWRQ
ncbi:MAG: hypothetical protein ACYCYM_07815 [Saccharofermentanales bacterium]